MTTVGTVDHQQNGFDPTAMLTEWDVGMVSTMDDGRTLRTFEVEAIDKEIEIAPGVALPAWTFNGRVPGPALRAKEGDGCGSFSATMAPIRTPCIFTASTPGAWTVFQGLD